MLELVDRGEMDREAIGGLAVCWLGVPLSVGDQTLGLIVVQSYDPAVVYGPADQELLSFVASQVANSLQRRRTAETLRLANVQLEQRVQERTQDLRTEILQRERAQEQLKHQIMHDGLTGLPNRAYLRDRLERVLQRLKREPGRRYALLFMDVDRFKLINDSLGHLAGDTVLKEVARRLQTCIRQPDIVVRLSGDEFAILLEDIRVPDTAVKVAQRVLAVMASPLQLKDGAVVEPSVSVGVAIGDANYLSADDVLRDADAAMYRAKKSGRKRFELFDDSLQKNAVDVLEMEIKLRAALLRDQFEPYFQPIVRMATGEVVGYESLLRWNHPTRGVIAPPEFLHIVQDNGSIEAVDWKMFEMACKLATRLDPGHYLTINVSPQHFRHADFDASLLALVERCGLPPSRLIIELHEGSMIDQPERVRATLDRLREAGIGAALLVVELPAHVFVAHAQDRPQLRHRPGQGRAEQQRQGRGRGDRDGESAGNGRGRRRHRNHRATRRADGTGLRIRPGLPAGPAGADQSLDCGKQQAVSCLAATDNPQLSIRML
jgi:diguanylate cyclase (GGDEF)-like protein